MGWLKFLKNIGNAESTREAIRLSYKKHFDGAVSAGHGTEPHSVGLYGALATRYRLMRKPVGEVQVWAELAPFLAMPVTTSIEALAEYIVFQERPGEARISWLKNEITTALHRDGQHRRFAALALKNQVLWSHWLDGQTIAAIEGVAAEQGSSGAAVSRRNESRPRSSFASRAENSLKYDLHKLRGGISLDYALQLFINACNKPDTMFITERWLGPRLLELQKHLSNPITTDQAQALQDAVMQRRPFKDVLGWLGAGCLVSWQEYQRQQDVLASEAERARIKEVRRRWKNADWEKIARLRAEGVHVYIPPEVAFKHDDDDLDSETDVDQDPPTKRRPK